MPSKKRKFDASKYKRLDFFFRQVELQHQQKQAVENLTFEVLKHKPKVSVQLRLLK